ncbi:MAG TPA: ATP-binding cassette domain-containing protein, partial [Reyranella sp.]|nr:ATP-binding cassette domain-containing protein [Reyranella sp.]
MDWHVASGEILGIIGPNGAGKSSCFAAVTHAVPRQGEVWLAGERITALPTHRLARLGLRRTFQQNAFFGELTLLENARAAMLREHSTSHRRPRILKQRQLAEERVLLEG